MNFLKGIPALVWAVVALLLVGLGGYASGCSRANAQWTAKLTDSTHVLDSTYQRLRDSILVSGEKVRVDSVAVVKWRDRWHTVAHTDSLLVSDTVRVPGPVVREIVRVGDSTIAACGLLVQDCQHTNVLLTQANTQLSSQRDLFRALAQKPRRFWPTVAVGAGVGFLVKALLFK